MSIHTSWSFEWGSPSSTLLTQFHIEFQIQFQIQFQIGFHIQIKIKMQVQTAICKLQFTTSNLPALIWNLETVNCKQQYGSRFRCKMHSENCNQEPVIFNLQSANCNLQNAICKMLTAICKLQSANCNMQTAICKLQYANCKLQSAFTFSI